MKSLATFKAQSRMRNSTLILIVLFGVVLSFSPLAADAQTAGATFVHLFEWTWNDIADECEQFLGPNGYTAVQVSPPHEHANLADSGYPWWQRYQVVSYQLVSRSGNRDEFAQMVSRCHAVGVDIYADAVINHMTGVYGQDGGSGPWYGFAGSEFTDYDYLDYDYADFHHCDLTPNDDISDYNSRAQVQTCELVNLADLDTGNPAVQAKIAVYLNDLLSLGVAGFRIDAAKHMAAADLTAILSQLDSANSYGAAPYIFQEVINDNSEPVRDYEYYVNGDVTEFRFTNRIGRIFRTGQLIELQDLGGADMIPNEQAVVFVDNHDNQRGNDALTYKDGDVYTLASVFMLAWPYGYPSVMSSFAFTQSDQGPPSDGSGHTTPIYTAGTPDFTGWVAEHRRLPIANMAQFRATAGSAAMTNWWSNNPDRIAFGRGDKAFVVINKTIAPMLETLQTGLSAGKYCDVINGALTVAGDNCTGPSVTVATDGTAIFAVYPLSAAAIHVNAKTASAASSLTIPTTFNVTVGTETGETVYVLGDIAELGGNAKANAITLTEMGFGVWSATIATLPANTLITYRYLKGVDLNNASFEGGVRQMITPDGGLEVRNDTWRIPPLAATFTVDVSANPPSAGEQVYLLGNVAELGNWNQANAIALTDSGSNLWTATVGLPYETDIEYKYLRGANAVSAAFEGGNNRTFTTPASGTVTRADVWNAGPTNPYKTSIFVRGSMNGWGTGNPMSLGNGYFTAILTLAAGEHQFKIASDDWQKVDFGAVDDGSKAVELGVPETLGAKGPNLVLTLAEAGQYKFTLDVADPAAPIVTVRKMFAANPYGVAVFVRGSMNEWGLADVMQFADGLFSAVVTLSAGEHEFKIASEFWDTANFGAGSDGQTVVLDTPKTLARTNDNVKITITEAGLYKFSVDPTEPEQPIVTVQKAATTTVTLHYRRSAGDYDGWGLHLWNNDPPALDQSELDGVTWDAPHPFDGDDDFGKVVALSVINPAATFGFIIHKGADKDHNGVDMSWTPAVDGLEIWMIQGSEQKFTSKDAALQAAINLPDLYVRGSMNDWKATNKMAVKGAIFTAVLSLPAGEIEFKIADADWGVGNFGAGDNQTVTLGTPKVLDGQNNLKLTVTEAGMYRFTLDAANPATPTLTVTTAQVAIIHYHRKNGDYAGWGLHLWNFNPPALAQSVIDGITWDNARPFDGEDDFGSYAVLDLVDPTAQFGFIIHKGEDKDHGGLDMTLIPATEGYEIWMAQGFTDKFTSKAEALIAAGAVGNLKEAAARWISRDSIAWNVNPASGTPFLYYDPDGTISIENGVVALGTAGQEIPLSFSGTMGSGTANDQKLAYLEYVSAWPRIDTSGLLDVGTLLTGALAIGLKNADGKLVDATSIQVAGILDDLFRYDGALGVVFAGGAPTLKLWAPTAQAVRVILYDDPAATIGTPLDLAKDPATGVWSVTGTADWMQKFYVYDVSVFSFWTGALAQNLVTDPYAVSLSANSQRSQIVDLSAPALKPAGWDGLQKPALNAPEDIVLYELHVRDFSMADETVSAAKRGKFTAFTETASNGMTHLKGLADAGLSHLHLLPVFDIATIDENAANRIELTDTMDALCAKPGVVDKLGSLCSDFAGRVLGEVLAETAAADPASEIPQQIAMSMRSFDGFNWGYDPFHYGVPEGSYCSDPNGTSRITEFRSMVSALNDIGLRVVMDVVYNHTNAARDAEKSVLDKIVPGYYYRLDDRGNIQNTTCCPDTATEHVMMEKLMLDTLKRWAVQYKVDGFRFDLMGHHTRANMLHVRAMLDSLTPATDGVDGSKIYIYGEGWKFGSIQANLPSTDDPDDIKDAAAFTQTNSAGAGIGTFNDRIRDMVRGAGFMKPPCAQGFISGLEFDPNGDAACTFDDAGYTLLNYADNIRVGMAGNLKDYVFTGHQGGTVSGQQVAYFGGAPAGYTADPQEVINYAEAHDNRTLWDYIQFQVPAATSLADRIRIQNLGLSLIALGQGVPFFHAGTDMLRSKSADEDSYDSGDWFNRLDFSYESNNWGAGLPNADKNAGEWDRLRPLLPNAALTPGKADILKAVNHFRELLQIRASSPLFRLRTAADIQQRVRFLNAEQGAAQLPGVIVMLVADPTSANLDPNRELVLVAVNATDEAVTFSHADLIGRLLELHPVQQNSFDAVVKQAAFDAVTGSLTMPARTAAVFQQTEIPVVVTPVPTSEPGAVPEPGTLGLLGLGLAALAAAMLKKRKL